MIASLWLRPLWQRPARSLGTVAGVAVGVASVVSTALASRAAVASMTSDVEALAGNARLEVTRPGGLPIDELALLGPIAGEVFLTPVVEGAALLEEPGGGTELVHVLGIDGATGAASERWTLDPGARAESEAFQDFVLGRGALLARSAAERQGLRPGDELVLTVQSRRVALAVAAVFEPEQVASTWERIIVVDVALAQELLGKGAIVDRVELEPRREQDLDALAARVRALLPEGARVAPPSTRREEGENLTRSLAFNLTALAGVSVLVGMVLVATTLATSVVQRRPVLALLRSLGASRGQLAVAVLLEAAAIGLLGGIAGVALGRWAAGRVAADVSGSVATIAEDALLGAVELRPLWIALGVLLGLGTALAASFLPLREAWRTPPLQGLRGDVPGGAASSRRARVLLLAGLLAGAWTCTRLPAWNGRPVWALTAALLLLATVLVLARPIVAFLARVPGRALGPPFQLAQAALLAARQRAAWAAGAVGVAVALAVSMTTLVGSFRTNLVEWTDQALRSDLYLRPFTGGTGGSGVSPGTLAPEVVRIVAARFGTQGLDPYHETTATVRGQPVALGGGVLAVVAREGGVPFLDGRDSREVFADALARHAVLVNEPFARRFGVHRGERIELTTAAGVFEREIAGVYRDYSGHTGRLIVDLDDYKTMRPGDGPQSIALFLPDGTDIEAARAALESDLAGRWLVDVLNHRELHDGVLRQFERTFAVTIGLQAIAGLVAALAVVLVLGALVRERRRELAIVRVLGASRAQLGGLVVSQALLLGLAGGAGGLAAGLVVGWVLVAVVNVQSFGWSLRFAPPPSVLWTALAVLPACVVAGLVPAWISWRARPQEALREEN